MGNQGNLNLSEQNIRVVEATTSVEVAPEEQQIQIIKEDDDVLNLVLSPPLEIDLEIETTKTLLSVADSRPDAHYIFTQNLPSSFWVIDHPLNKHPSVEVVDSGGNLVEGSVHYVSVSRLEISFAAPFGGIAYLN